MSYWVSLEQDGEAVSVPQHEGEGGTYQVGGTEQATLNLTSNYEDVYRLTDFDGIRWLHGQRAADTVSALEAAVAKLGTRRYADYWAPTPGNAGHALGILLGWARLHPGAVWRVN